ncbi:MAG: N-acetyl-gamma-glutamyl-phosphate reductase [Paramuribaculum sp.]|nr:N-acetyl-gamma-glutamyl-phosphate reductase [Paramuribaculum sp.]
MIKAGIVGGESDSAGNLIRILINHPDVELCWVESLTEEGELLSSKHKGLTGETYMSFCKKGNKDEIDVLFLCFAEDGDSENYLANNPLPEKVKIIDLSPDFRRPDSEDSPWVYALPELNRKPLVRGATKASIPGSLATVMILALLPLAKNLLLNSPIHVSCVTPLNGNEEAGEASVVLEHEEVEETQNALKTLQESFRAPINLIGTAGGWKEGLAATIYMDTPISEDDLKDIYDTYYEDHGFTFMSEDFPDLGEVRGTNKCLIHLEKVDNKVVVSAVLDDTLKGGAAAAVHVMNLLFGLQERVGLTLAAKG